MNMEVNLNERELIEKFREVLAAGGYGQVKADITYNPNRKCVDIVITTMTTCKRSQPHNP